MSRLVWAATTVVRVGDVHVGIRSSTAAIRDALETAFAPHLVDDPAAPASHAIHAPDDLGAGTRPVYRVFEECSPAFVTPSLDRAIAVLAGYLTDYLAKEQSAPTVVDVEAAAVLGPRSAIVLPWQVPYLEPASERTLRRAGARVLERRRIQIDTATAELVVTPALRLEADRLDPAAVTAPGRTPIDGWVFLGSSAERGSFTRAQALVHALAVTHRPSTVTANLRRLAPLLEQLEVRLASDADGSLRAAIELLDR
jgi:hypothetical protein